MGAFRIDAATILMFIPPPRGRFLREVLSRNSLPRVFKTLRPMGPPLGSREKDPSAGHPVTNERSVITVLFEVITLKRLLIPLLLLLSLLLSVTPVHSQDIESQRPLVLTLNIGEMITKGSASRIERGLKEASEQNAAALVITLDTPGGLLDATLDILSTLLAADVPVITYVTPQGAMAASAGAFILITGHISAMTPGTTTGAAMPVTISPDESGSQPADDKTIQFLAEHIRSIAEVRGRPGDIIQLFVTENLSLGSQEAQEKGVVDHVAPDLESLLDSIHGTEVELEDRTVTMVTRNATLETLEPNLVEQITHLISNPQITFILLLIGIYGLIIGFSTPGTFFPEVLGGISLILALFGLGMFEVNLFAIILMVLGLALLIAEAFTPDYGILGIGGIASLVLGILYLPVEPLVADRWLLQFRVMALGIGIVGSVFLLILLTGIIRLRRIPVRGSREEIFKETGTAGEPLDPEGYIQVRGELWKARSSDGSPIPAGTRVRILDQQGMLYIVEPLPATTDGTDGTNETDEAKEL